MNSSDFQALVGEHIAGDAGQMMRDEADLPRVTTVGTDEKGPWRCQGPLILIKGFLAA